MSARVMPAPGYAQEIDAIAHDAYCGRDDDWIDTMTDDECRNMVRELYAVLFELDKPREERMTNATLIIVSQIEEYAERVWEAQ